MGGMSGRSLANWLAVSEKPLRVCQYTGRSTGDWKVWDPAFGAEARLLPESAPDNEHRGRRSFVFNRPITRHGEDANG